jgi:tetratricopeptide (TPR) repeat protein
MEHLRDVNSNAFGLAGQISLAKLYCEMGQSIEAEQLARKLIQDAAGNMETLDSIRADLIPSLSSSLDEKQFEDLLIWAGNTNRDYWGWSYERGQFFMVKGKYRQAQQAFAETWTAVAKAKMELKLGILDSYCNAQFKAGAYNDLLKLMKEVSEELGKDIFLTSCWKAAAYLGLDQKQKGFEFLAKALENEKNPLLIWQVTTNTILKATDPGELVSALSGQAASAGTQVALACSYFAAGDFAKGDAIYRQLAGTAKDTQEKIMYLYVLGQEYTNKHKYDEAVGAFEEVKKMDPENLAVLNNLAYILEEYLNKVPQALELITPKFIAVSTNPDLLDTYGQILVKTGKIDEGLYNTAKSVWIRESSASRYHLGMILLKQDRRVEAKIQLNRALKLVGDDAELEKSIRTELDKL